MKISADNQELTRSTDISGNPLLFTCSAFETDLDSFFALSNSSSYFYRHVRAVFTCNEGNFELYDLTVASAPYLLVHFSILNQSSAAYF